MLGGAFSGLNNYLPTMLQGEITNGNTNIQVPYNNFGMFVSTVEQGASLLDSYLKSGTGPMVAFGHSLGAVVCNYWLLHYAPTTTIEPADLSFVWIGNSVSVYGGALGPTAGTEWQNWFGNVTAPATTPFTCLNVARQYDGWADYPQGTFNADATFNALAGQGVIHPNYQNVSPSPTASGNVSHVVGNITYVWSQTEPVPLLGSTWDSVTSGLDETLRPTIEAAYSRPVTIATPSY